MPFCSQCGNAVNAADVYCAGCGARQPVTASATATDPLASLSPRTAAILCYLPIVGWVPAIIVLAANKFRTNRYVRFHAFQGLYLFVAWLIVQEVVKPMFAPLPGPNFVGTFLCLSVMAVWIFMLVKTSRDEMYSLPVLGELAEKSIADS